MASFYPTKLLQQHPVKELEVVDEILLGYTITSNNFSLLK